MWSDKRLTEIIGARTFHMRHFSSGRLVAPAGEWHLSADRRLRKGVGDLHAHLPISTAY